MRQAFEAPTAAQRLAWPSIARGESVLVLSPTGSGKTLAAFLWAINELIELGQSDEMPAGPHVVYVSPLRALANDIHRNLITPLEQIREIGRKLKVPVPDIRVALRTGDTPPKDRRRMLRQPPHILITTPESLYLLLNSGFREHLCGPRYAIVDEIHHICGNKRGAHLAISLERLEQLRADADRQALVRIGLSATQAPIEDIARFLTGLSDDGSQRRCTVVDLGVARGMDLQVIAPVPNLAEARPEDIWQAIHEQLFDLIEQHRTTLVFCNSKHITERTATRLNMIAQQRCRAVRIGAHHGSLSRAVRLQMEEALKSGELHAVVATSSLELGIDIGHLDLVCQVGSPKTVSSGLQRVGRSGHVLGLTSKGRLFATGRDDLVELAVLARAMADADLEPVRIPMQCLDVAAQQVAAMVAAGDTSPSCMLKVLRRAYNFRDLDREQLDRILAQLSGAFDGRELFHTVPRLSWDPFSDEVAPARGTLGIVQQNAGTIPDHAEYAVHAQDYDKRIGALTEEFVQRLYPGLLFVLGARTWQFQRVEGNRVYVTDGGGRGPTIPYWHGADVIARPFSVGVQVARFRDAVFSRLFGPPHDLRHWLRDAHALEDAAAGQLVEYFLEQAHSLDTWPGCDCIVAEVTRSPLGHRQIIVHSPYGSRLNEAWAQALAQAAREDMELDLQLTYNDDAFALHLPAEAHTKVERVLALVTRDNARSLARPWVRDSALFAIRFRHVAVRSLAVLRMAAGTRRAVWQQEAAGSRRAREVEPMDTFPLIEETLRECTQDHLDLDNLIALLAALQDHRMRLVVAPAEAPSPFSHELLLTGQFGVPGEAGRRERRAQLLSLHRRVLKQMLDEDGIRELLGADVVEAFEAERQGTALPARARDAEELLRLIRRCGELSEDPGSPLFIGLRASPQWPEWIEDLRRSQRAVRVAFPGAHRDAKRWIDVRDYRLYAAAFARKPKKGTHRAKVLSVLARRGPATRSQLARAGTQDSAELLEALEQAYEVVPSGQPDGEPLWALSEHWVPAPSQKAPGRPTARRQIILRALRSLGPTAICQIAHRYGLAESSVRSALNRPVDTGEVQQGGFTHGRPIPQVCVRGNLEELHRRALAALHRQVEPVDMGRYTDYLLRRQHVHPDAHVSGPEGLAQVIGQLAGYTTYPRLWQRDVLGARLMPFEAGEFDALLADGRVRMGHFDLGKQRRRAPLAGLAFIPDDRLDGLVGVPKREDLPPDALPVLDLLASAGPSALEQIADSLSMQNELLEALLWSLFTAGAVANTDHACVLRCRWTGPTKVGGQIAAYTGAPEPADSPSDARQASGSQLRRAGLRADRGEWYAVSVPAADDQSEDLKAYRCRERVIALMRRYGVAGREMLMAASDMPARDVAFGLRQLFLRGQIIRGFFVRGLSGDQFALPEALRALRHPQVGRPAKAVMVCSLDPAVTHPGIRGPRGVLSRPRPTLYVIVHRGDPIAIVERHAPESRFLRIKQVSVLYPETARGPKRDAALHRRVALAIVEYAARWAPWETVRISRINDQAIDPDSDVAQTFLAAGFRLQRGELAYRLRKRVAPPPEPMKRIVTTRRQRPEDIRLDSTPVLEFLHHVLEDYEPPADKDMLVFLQCSVSRPYSQSPSHASMRKAIRLATGHDPRAEFEDCRCHVVVLSSLIGPVPYELETVYPADERGGGVKHMSEEQFAAAGPVLAQRMADYVTRWHERYKTISTFTHGRYAEVMLQAQGLCGVDFAVLPDMKGLRLKGGRQYWTKYWIQLFYELIGGISEPDQEAAMARLAQERVQIEEA